MGNNFCHGPKGDQNMIPGGLVELSLDGQVIQTGDADPGDPDIYLRPYGLVLLPDSDRAMVTTYDMRGIGLARHIQIWRLSDLTLLQTMPVPPSPTRQTNIDPFAGRVLADGQTIMFETLSCGLYLLYLFTADAGVGAGQKRPPRLSYSACSGPGGSRFANWANGLNGLRASWVD